MTQYIGQITIILETDTAQRASETLRLLAKQLDDIRPEVVFADHNGEVEDYESIEHECEESLNTASYAGAGLPVCFDDYDVHGIREFGEPGRTYCEQVPDADAQRWSLFGHIPGQGAECIGDFATRDHAEEVYARITGRPYGPRRPSRHLLGEDPA